MTYVIHFINQLGLLLALQWIVVFVILTCLGLVFLTLINCLFSRRDLKIENLLLDENNNIKLIGMQIL